MTNDEEELRWYYTSAASECGIRSIQGGIQAALERGYVLGGYSPVFDGPTDRRVAAWGRLRAVWQRIARLPLHEQRVLELAYSGAAACGPVALALAASQERAVRAHGAAKEAAGHTVAQWLVWLAARREEAAMRLMAEIVADARQELRAALAAYARAGEEAAA